MYLHHHSQGIEMSLTHINEMAYVKAAVKKLGDVPENFFIYKLAWMGFGEAAFMQLTGAVFREAKKGKNKGEMCIAIKGSEKVTHMTHEEIDIAEVRK